MMQLTKDFYLEEFLVSETAARKGEKIVPTPEEILSITRLCKTLLQPIRTKLNRPMVITSGLRPLWLNLEIGGSTNSAHIKGLAADIRVVGMSPEVFCRWVQQNAEAEDWHFDQCILEFGQWTHLSIAEVPRMQYLTAKSVKGSTVYLPGLVA